MAQFIDDTLGIDGGAFYDPSSGNTTLQSFGPSGCISIEDQNDYLFAVWDPNSGNAFVRNGDTISGTMRVESVCGEMFFGDGFFKNYTLTEPDERTLDPFYQNYSIVGNFNEIFGLVGASASPGFTWGKNGGLSSGSYLRNDDVESNKSGRLVPFDGFITNVFVNNENTAGAKTLEIVRRRPCQTGPEVTIASVTLTNGNACGSFNVSAAVLEGDELLVKSSNSSAKFKNVIAGVIIKNNTGSGAIGGQFLRAFDNGNLIESAVTTIDFGDNLSVSGNNAGAILITGQAGGGGSGGGSSFAFGRVESNGTLLGNLNASVSRVSTGIYDVTFITPADNDEYPIVLGIEQNAGTDDYHFAYTNVTTAGFRVEIKEQDDGGGGGTFRDSGFSFDIPDDASVSGASGEVNNGNNVGGGAGVFRDKTGLNLNFRSLVPSSNVFITENANTIEIGVSGISSGETNTASNVGGGSEVFKQKTAQDLEFRTLTAGSNISLSQTANNIEISVSGISAGESNTASNVGSGADVFKQKSGIDLEFRGVDGVSGVDAQVVGDNIQISLSDQDINKVTRIVEVGGNQNITAGANIDFDTNPALASSVAILSGTTGLEIQKDGSYEVGFGATLTNNSGGSRTDSSIVLRVNGVDVNGTKGFAYNRNGSQGSSDVARTVKGLNLSVGDILTVFAIRESGGGTIVVQPNTAYLEVMYLRGSN